MVFSPNPPNSPMVPGSRLALDGVAEYLYTIILILMWKSLGLLLKLSQVQGLNVTCTPCYSRI